MILPAGQGLHDRRRRCDKCKARKEIKGGKCSQDGRSFKCRECL